MCVYKYIYIYISISLIKRSLLKGVALSGSDVVGCKVPRKQNSPIFLIFFAPPPFLFPRVDLRLT